MTTFDTQQPYLGDHEEQPKKTSGLAVASLICSLIICCPLLTILGPILGLVAIISINRDPARRKGAGMAMAGILIGLVVTILWIVTVIWGYQNFGKPQAEGPREALAAGFAGDPAGFRQQFFGDAARASDDEVEAFVATLRDRYGEFVSMRRDEAAFRADPPDFEDMMAPIQEFPYRIEFTNATVGATIGSAAADPNTGQFFWGVRFHHIVIHDPDRGDIEFPPPPQP